MTMNENENANPTRPEVDFMDKAFIQQPFAAYERLREEEPVHRFLLPGGQFAWLVSRYEDALKVLQDSRFVTNPRMPVMKKLLCLRTRKLFLEI